MPKKRRGSRIISKTKEITIGDLPENLFNEHANLLGRYSVAFAVANSGNPRVLGSGTLVQFENIRGILTAQHVVSELIRFPQVELLVQQNPHRFTLEKDQLIILSTDRGTSPEDGPDLSFIRLPEHRVGTLESIKTFVNLLKHEAKSKTFSRDKGLWTVCGCPAEESTTDVQPGELLLRASFECFVGPAPEQYTTSGSFDYYLSRARYGPDSVLPTCFGGVSGGGLWQTKLCDQEESLKISDHVFRGVAFYQSERAGDSRFIKCHGDKGIHEWLRNKLQEHGQ